MDTSVRGWLIALSFAVLSACGGNAPPTAGRTNPSPSIATLSQFSAVSGSAPIHLTITGSNFVAGSTVQWNGSARPTTVAGASEVSTDIPSSDLASAGNAQITIENPAPGGGDSSAIAFTVYPPVAAGVLLTADPKSPARGATSDVIGSGVSAAMLQDGVILNQIEVFFKFDASVAQVDDALSSVGAGIVSMTPNSTAMLAQVSPQNSAAAIQDIAMTLAAKPGVLHAFAGIAAFSQVLPTDQPGDFQDTHLLPTRFPAAWNLKDLALPGCESKKIAVIVSDDFDASAPSGFFEEVPNFMVTGSGGATLHGYAVATTMAAKFDGLSPTGANPFPQCLQITGVQIASVDWLVLTKNVLSNFPAAGPFLLNLSQGFKANCAVETGPQSERRCTAASILNTIQSGMQRAELGLFWKSQTQDKWNRFLAATSGGNSRQAVGTNPDTLVGSIYAGAAIAQYNNPLTVAAGPDPHFGFAANASLWSPLTEPDLPNLTADPSAALAFSELIDATGMDRVAGENNVIVTGSTTPGAGYGALQVSLFSNISPDVSVVGEQVTTLTGPDSGTSVASPQVLGLASYLWLLSDDLRNAQPASATRHAILDNARSTAAGPVIDAYASVLSLDPPGVPTPASARMREQLLDVTGSPGFDEADIELFLRHFFLANPDGSISNVPAPIASPDYSRFDLNGDGFTTAAPLFEQFDLDRTGSTQYGAAVYGVVSEPIEGQQVNFNEQALSDLQILCYYAYSPMLAESADKDARTALLAGRCGLSISPASTSVSASTSTTFTAASPGNDPVSWSASCGTISSSDATHGVYLAPDTPQGCTVTAVDTANSALTASASVSVTPGGGEIGSESSVGIDLRGFDIHAGNSVFDQVSTFVTATGHDDLQSPLEVVRTGSYRPDSALPPTDYNVHVLSSGPIIEGSDTQPASGAYALSVSCSNTGTAIHDPENPDIVHRPADISLRAGASETFEPLSRTPGSYSLSFTMTRGQVVSGAAFNHSGLIGLMSIEYSLHGEEPTQLQYEINDGTLDTGNTPSVVSGGANVFIEQGGFFQATWNMTASCQPEYDKEQLVSKRAGSITVGYTVAQ